MVTTGPYRYVRHPFYLTFAVGVVGGSIAMANWFILLAGTIPFAFLVARTRIAKDNLVKHFGIDYQDYMRWAGHFWVYASRRGKPSQILQWPSKTSKMKAL